MDERQTNMHPGLPAVKTCPQGESFFDCNLRCKYNRFEKDELRIDSWELRCLDCGYRDTIAFRSDDSDLNLDEVDPAKCPFCGLAGAASGRDPCVGSEKD